MSLEALEFLSSGGVPQAGRPIPPASQHPLPVRCETHRQHLPGVPLKPPELLAEVEIPQPGHVIATAEQDPLAVRRQRRSYNPSVVRSELLQLLARFGVP